MRVRRTSLSFALLASTALILGGCGDDPQTETKEQPIFHTVEECRAAFDSDQCEQMSREAQAEHEKTAPKFDSLQACENQFDSGKCRATTTVVNGQSQVSYAPVLAGFVAGAIGAVVAAHVINGMAQPNMQRRATPVYESPITDTQRKCRNFPSSPECRTSGGGGATRTSYAYGGTTVATTSAAGRVTTQVTRQAPGGFWNSRTATTPNDNARTPVAPSPVQRQTMPSPVPKVSAPPTPAPTQAAPRPTWAPPKVTASPTAPTTRGGFGGSAVSRGGFSSGGGSRGGGGGGT